MKIVLIGTGRMGSAIEKIAIQNGDEIILKIDETNRSNFNDAIFSKADIAIEFTKPEVAVENLLLCLQYNIPVVCGTTGWHDQYEEVKTKFIDKKGSLIHASNFSVGVNIMFELNRKLAQWMSIQKQYLPAITEVHHTHKLDKPSGTAVTLLNDIILNNSRFNNWKLSEDFQNLPNTIPVNAIRKDEVVGDHTVEWISPIDKISIQHEAFSRDGFALGALLAGHWIQGKQGVFTMNEVLFNSY